MAGQEPGTRGGTGQRAPQYTAGDLQQRLAEDPRTAELGIHVVLRGEQLFLRGQVASAERRARIVEVVNELVPGLDIHNELGVTPMGRPEDEERL